MRDPQTLLPNLDGLVDRDPQLASGAVLVIELLDLDMIATAFGAALSRQVASGAAARLRTHALEHGFRVGRIAPARFALLMPDLEDHLDIRRHVRELRSMLVDPMARTHLELEARFAFGVSLAPEHGTDVAELIRRATNGLTEGSGADVRWFTPEMDTQATARLELASDLREAIANDGLSIAYQPKVDVATGRVTGVEALARWAHPTRGYVGPGEFIDVAERTGLIRPLTEWVANTAIDQAARWRALGHQVSVAINLSTLVLDDEVLSRQIINTAEAQGVPPWALTMEITESQMMGDFERGGGILAMFDAAGIHLSVDDFGTGYSSLAQLKALPVDELKIDRAFVRHLATSAHDRAIVEAIILMAQNLDLRVVAEGIEDAESLRILSDMGCDIAQGFHLHRPMPAADVTRLLAAEATPHDRVVVPIRTADRVAT